MSSPLTVEVLAARLEGLTRTLEERDRRMQERFNTQQESLRASEVLLAEYKGNANEWRGALNDYRSMTMSRTEYEAKHQNLGDRIDELQRALDRMLGRLIVLETGAKNRVSMMTIWVMGAGVMASFLLALIQLIRPH